MVIDCDRCEVRGDACGDCVVGVLLGVPGVPQRAAPDAPDALSGAAAVHLDAPERRALAVLADQGLVPRLRLVAGSSREVTEGDHSPRKDHDVG